MERAELLRVLGDATRLRVWLVLHAEELTVSELQQVLALGQSTVSGHLAQLRGAGLAVARRDGPHTRYSSAAPAGEAELLRVLAGTPLPAPDRAALDRVLAERVAPSPEGLGPDYIPGRSWEALAHLLLALLPPLRIADLGTGTGRLTQLLAARAARLIAVDTDAAALARLGPPIETRIGDLADPPLRPGEVDLILLSQSLHCVADPVAALRRCHALLPPGGRVAVLDLLPHPHAWVRHRLGHHHQGFADLGGMLREAGFGAVTTQVVHRDRAPPAFQTVMGIGTRTESGSPTS